SQVYLIIADARIEGIYESLGPIKNDDMFRHIPIIVILPTDEPAAIEEAFSFGVDNIIVENDVPRLLYAYVRPLVRNNIFNGEMMQKISELQEQAIRDFILLDLIKNYIPKTIWDIAKDFAHKQKISIPEEETELTIVFADIKGFTPITQHMAPREVIHTLNAVFDIATRIVYESGGDIDKFIGDAFFAVYTDARNAVKSMVEVQKEIASMNEARIQEGLPAIRFRIGIHTGPVIRGNVGGNMRFDNTLIGDTVNMASRLEEIAEAGGILISEETMKAAGLSIPQEYQDCVQLRGRDVQDSVYNVYDYLVSLSSTKKA
ncbi:MAG TPA: adenylate/guanylate cyclase domain-containing protein, partial [Spirochaetia bacterium]|nr:adenylate/guanylate cyclase domain-containing protein [Spirochaetia bacterium]